MEFESFKQAKPIWANNIVETKNVHLKLYAEVKKNSADMIRIATSCFYQLFVNGEYIAYGPARAGRGYFRVDEIVIGDKLK